MKKLGLLALTLVGFMFIAAPIYMKYDTRGVVANGKPFVNAQLVNGIWAVPLDEFAKAFGGNLTLEPNFQLNGNRLTGNLTNLSSDQKHKVEPKVKIEASAGLNTIGGSTPASGELVPAVDKTRVKFESPSLFTVRKAGLISSKVFMVNGKAYVPLADIAKAFGGTFTAPTGKLQPGQSLSLNFAINGDGILAMKQ